MEGWLLQPWTLDLACKPERNLQNASAIALRKGASRLRGAGGRNATERTEEEEATTRKWNFLLHPRGELDIFPKLLILRFLRYLLFTPSSLFG